MSSSPVFIGTAEETFTPTQSGAIATIIHQLSLLATKDGLSPVAIMKRSPGDVACFEDVAVKFFDYPQIPTKSLQLFWQRLERKFFGWNRLRLGKWMQSVLQIIKQHGLTNRPIVVSNEPELAVYLKQRLSSSSVTLWFHNHLTCKSRYRTRVARSCDAIAGVSQFSAQWISDYYSAPSTKVIYPAVDSALFSPEAQKHYHRPIIQFVGRTGIEKAPDLLLRACLRLVDRTNAFSVRLVGSNHFDGFTRDSYQDELAELAQRLKAHGVEIERTGHVGRKELPALMRTAHIHVTPSRWAEPFGLTTVEGMASGLATVASDTGGSPEIIGDAGILFKPDDEKDLAEKLWQLLSSPEMIQNIGQRCRSRSLIFDWNTCWESLKDVIKHEV